MLNISRFIISDKIQQSQRKLFSKLPVAWAIVCTLDFFQFNSRNDPKYKLWNIRIVDVRLSSFAKLNVGWWKQIGCLREYLQESKYRQSLAIEITNDLTRFSQFTITRSSDSVLTLDDCFLQQVPLLITRRPRVLVRVPRRLWRWRPIVKEQSRKKEEMVAG